MGNIYLLLNSIIFRLLQKGFYLILVVLLTNQVHSQQQSDTLLQNQSQLTIETQDFSDIPKKLENLGTLIKKTVEMLNASNNLGGELLDLRKIQREVNLLQNLTDSMNFYDEYTATLIELQQNWREYKKSLSSWSDYTTQKSKDLEEQRNNLILERASWSYLDSITNIQNLPVEFLDKIKNQLQVLDTLNNFLAGKVYTYININSKLSEDLFYVDSKLKDLEQILLDRKKQVFIQNYPPIWESVIIDNFGKDIATQSKIIWESRIRSASHFFLTNKNKLFADLFFFFLFSFFVLGLTRTSKTLATDDQKILQAIELFKHPFSISLLVFLFYVIAYYSNAPEVVISGVKIIMVVPLILILHTMITSVLRLPIHIFSALVILQQFNVISESRTTLARLMLLAFLLVSLIILLWALRKKKYLHQSIKSTHQDIIKFILKTVFIIFIIAFTANLFGFVPLSSLLVNGTINSLYSILLFYTVIISVESVLIIFLQSKFSKRIKIFKEYPEKVSFTIAKYLKPVIILIAFFIIVSNFGLKEIFLNWISVSLENKFELGSFTFTLSNIFVFIGSIWLSIIIARLIKFILQGEILSRFELARGVPGAISSITSYFIIGFGIIGAIIGTGINLDNFAMLASALGVGIGFGLQDLVKNFISGLILIFERPIQIGDSVQIEEMNGMVKHIGIRSSTVRTWDGAEVIVPNGNLISNKLINWTLSDRKRRIDILVGVAYGSDINEVMQVLLDCASQHQDVLSYPSPTILFNGFADSSLHFELRCWTSKGESWLNIKSDIYVLINNSFAEKNIVIPFPQRDLHIKSNEIKIN